MNGFKEDVPVSNGSVFVGVDIGSTTAKLVIRDGEEIIYKKYERHYSQVRTKTLQMLEDAKEYLEGKEIKIAISGSAGLGVAEAAGISFVQEVYATYALVKEKEPGTDAVIELGGEDAKIIFLKGGVDERMNGTCAGGTGAFIDQMATLLNVTPDELDELSLQCGKIYPIASRCGVFAKTDIQPLINQGVQKSDIAASIYQAVVNQTISGLAQGRKIEGKVVFLGGPLYYNKGLRKSFQDTLKLDDEHAIFPDYALISVALGASIFASNQQESSTYEDIISAIRATLSGKTTVNTMAPLFASRAEREEFKARHAKENVEYADISSYTGDAYLGIDCGSTTTKLVLMGANKEILWSYYDSNKGNPVDVVKNQLIEVRTLCGDRITIRGSGVTGYGEELILNAFHVDKGLVETMAHFMAAKQFEPDVDFILDIGGQDIKCIKIKNNAVDSIMLNEACSSGCGSFIETFAKSMGYKAPEFALLGLEGDAPVDLGSRCTVFMNSSIKQAQKDGVSVQNISAGLSVSVIKNAIYKVIRANSPTELGDHIVVQGGTFLNDAILRAFENEIGHPVTRPMIAGIMGAYGAAIYAMESKGKKVQSADGKSAAEGAPDDSAASTLLTLEQLRNFTHTSKAAVCPGCTNHCALTINTFSDGGKFISGNRCEKMKNGGRRKAEGLNLYEFKRKKLEEMFDSDRPKEGDADAAGNKLTIGLPLQLGMYDLAPLWYGLYTDLGFRVVFSGFSSRNTYLAGQDSIPSDTACYPAKIMHGHIVKLIEDGVDAIFAPCLTYNLDENAGDNHYNCPIVAYYPELLKDNMDILKEVTYFQPFLNINDEKELARELAMLMPEKLGKFTEAQYLHAIRHGFDLYHRYHEEIRKEADRIVEEAHKRGMRIMVLAGRPYHVDPEINHGIDLLAESLGFAIITEDSIAYRIGRIPTKVLNQWTYHARLYSAAEYVTERDDMELVQLVSFGCGIDAITSDEVRSILERKGRIYTQIKIDEINNLSAVNIRLRSLLGALEMRDRE
ncbi:MAG: acyl-CoA dehydratase activase [Lachnospiraceae bacterium]|nr:acyl-CoA dehydratase activase [Lachnospiraceae bacterium]